MPNPKRSRKQPQIAAESDGTWEPRDIPPETLVSLASRLGVHDRDGQSVVEASLVDIDADYRCEKEQRIKRPTRGEARAALRKIADLADDLSGRLFGLDVVAGDALLNALYADVGLDDNLRFGLIDRLSNELRILREKARTGELVLAQGSDTPRRDDLERAIFRLCELWKTHAGSNVATTRLEETGETVSPGGQFVTAAMEYIDIEVRPEQVSTIIRKLSKNGRTTA